MRTLALLFGLLFAVSCTSSNGGDGPLAGCEGGGYTSDAAGSSPDAGNFPSP